MSVFETNKCRFYVFDVVRICFYTTDNHTYMYIYNYTKFIYIIHTYAYMTLII